MLTERTALPWSDGDGTGRATIDITLPYAQTEGIHLLHREWQRQGGGLKPVPELTLPERTDGAYAIHMRMRRMADLVVQEAYTDQIAGHCRWDDRIIAVFQLRGRSRLTGARQMNTVSAGLVCAVRNESNWDWEVSEGTRVAVLALPEAEVRFPKNRRSLTAAQGSPSARLLLAHLRSWAEVNDDLSPAASWAARNAAVELFHGLLNDRVIDDEQLSGTLVRAAQEWIESRLLDGGLSPRAVADSLSVSTRTLHRAFASQAMSVMGYVRERRLDRARSELTSTSLMVSEIAARWHFADSSHFIKAYKKRFGELPSVRRFL